MSLDLTKPQLTNFLQPTIITWLTRELVLSELYYQNAAQYNGLNHWFIVSLSLMVIRRLTGQKWPRSTSLLYNSLVHEEITTRRHVVKL